VIRNYLKTAYRNLLRSKGFTIINTIGLAIGITCSGLIFLWMEDEYTYNHYFKNRDNLYSVKNIQTYDGETFVFDATPGPFAKQAQSEIPGIKSTTRSCWGSQLLFSTGKEKSLYLRGNFVDSTFFNMFELEFIEGSASQAFKQVHSIVLTEKGAHKLFGKTNVTGSIVKINNGDPCTVTAVVKNFPPNTEFNFEWLAPFKIYENQSPWLTGWGSNSIITYAELAPNANVTDINKKLYGYMETKEKGSVSKLWLYPMEKWRLYNRFDRNGKEIEGRIRFVRLFGYIAFFILLIACINFMNLATARSEKRAREVGVRKVLGSARKDLIFQFISESLITSLTASLIAILLVQLFLSPFNTLVQKQLTLDLFSPSHFMFLSAIIVGCGLVAGSYPAFYLSSFAPVQVLKGVRIGRSGRGAGMLRKSLVVLQFSISVVLMIGTIIIYKQIEHIKNRDIGYVKEGLIYTNLNGDLKKHFSAVKADLIKTGYVKNACLSSSSVLQLGSNTGDFGWPGKGASKQVLITVEQVSPEYVSTAGLHIREGRDFYTDAVGDSNSVIINETLAKMIGKNVVGTQLHRGDQTTYTIVGVIDDFIYNSMYTQAQPMILFSYVPGTSFLSMRLQKNSQPGAALSSIESVLKKYNPGYPVECSFVDEQFNNLFKTEVLIGKLSGIFASIAIFICCLGLFGLTAYMTERRAKEISIRKVLGASMQRLAILLSKDFLTLVIISCLVAFPLAWWIMNSWLEDFKYRISLPWWAFVLAGCLSVLIAFITISFQSLRAILANPIKKLRTE
jgi:predicted permease